MATGDKQRLITDIVSTVLGETAKTDLKFSWFINKHLKEHFREDFELIDKIFETLNGHRNANQSKRTTFLECDAFFGGTYNFIFEFDEYQHFSTARLKTLQLYPNDLKTNFLIYDWLKFCSKHKEKADKYRQSKKTKDFNFRGGRTAQRAYLDCFRDLLPKHNGLNPTLRISDFEVADILSNNSNSRKKIEKILEYKLK